MIGCASDDANFDVDVSNIDYKPIIKRFDKTFDSLEFENAISDAAFLDSLYGDFAEFYLYQIIKTGLKESQTFKVKCQDFKNYCIVSDIESSVKKLYNNDKTIEDLFVDGFKHFRYYFPNDTLSDIYTIYGGFQESIFPTDGITAICLEKYLGEDFANYESVGIEVYKRKKMNPENMPVDFFKTYAMLNFSLDEENATTLLCEMIYQGRIMYFINAILPNIPDESRWGITNYQYRWQKEYEAEIWDYLVQKKILFSTNVMEIRNFTGIGPFTNAFGNQSAPGCANYCGFKIVCSYMKNNPNVSLKDLMQEKDLMKIYNLARYKP